MLVMGGWALVIGLISPVCMSSFGEQVWLHQPGAELQLLDTTR